MFETIEKMVNKKAVTDMTPAQLGDWYLNQAMEFEKSKTQDSKKSERLAWRVASGAGVIAAIAIIAGASVTFINKPNPPAVLRVNDSSGEITMLKTLSDGKVSYEEVTDLYNLRRYVNNRESYDWETLQDLYDATIQMSNAREGKLYEAFNSESNKAAPVNVLKDKFRVIAKAGTVSFIEKTALVSFTKTTKQFSGQPPTIEYFVATIAFEYQNVPMDDKARRINPSGFKVTSYRVDRDITKSTAVQNDPNSVAGGQQ